jgi:RNA polymerase sigma-70 factor, ECF subfamily
LPKFFLVILNFHQFTQKKGDLRTIIGMEETEKQYLEELKKGDEKALRWIFDQYYFFLVHEIHRIIKDEDACKDIAQDVFTEIWRKREQLNITISLKAYLRRAGYNRAINQIKLDKRLPLDNDADYALDLIAVLPEDFQLVKPTTLEERLHQTIGLLPEKCRIVFNLSRFEQKSHKEIAEELGISVKTIENQITKALKFVREEMQKFKHLSPISILMVQLFFRDF